MNQERIVPNHFSIFAVRRGSGGCADGRQIENRVFRSQRSCGQTGRFFRCTCKTTHSMKANTVGKNLRPKVLWLLFSMALVLFQGAFDAATAAAPAGYSLNWSDEFNGTSIDTSKWRVPNGEDHFG